MEGEEGRRGGGRGGEGEWSDVGAERGTEPEKVRGCQT